MAFPLKPFAAEPVDVQGAVPPEVADFIRRQQPVAELPQHTAQAMDAADLDAALSADREQADRNRMAATLNDAASQMFGVRRPDLPLPPVDEKIKEWLLKRQIRDQDDAKSLARRELQRKNALEAGKFGLDVYKTGAEVGKIGAETGKIGQETAGLQRKNGPVTGAIRTMAGALGIDVPETATEQEAMDLIDPALKRQGINVDWAKLALDRDRLDFDKTKEPAAKKTQADNLRAQLQNQQTYKDTQNVAAMYRKIQGASPNAAGDMSLIYGYMKIVDPGSTVREGEYASAKNAAGWPERMRVAYNNALAGEILAPKMRAEFKGEAKRLYEAQRAQFAPLEREYRRLATQAGVSPADVVLDVFEGGGGKITVSNGKETLRIDPSDLGAAQAEGFREVQ